MLSKDAFKKHCLPLAALAVITFALFLNSLRGSFIWDDNDVIVEHKFIKNPRYMFFLFSPEYWEQDPGSARGQYRPLSRMTFAIDHFLWKLMPQGYHATNLLLHILNVFLVYFVALLLAGRPPDENTPAAGRMAVFFTAPFLAGVLFAALPVHTESVAWIKNRSDLLASLFFAASFLLFAVSRDNASGHLRKGLYISSLLSFVLALFSKEMALTLPLILGLYVLCLAPRARVKRLLARTLPFWVISAVFVSFKASILGMPLPGAGQQAGPGIYTRVLVVIKTYGSYLRLLLLPFDLNAERMFTVPSSFFEPGVALSLAAVLCLLGISVWLFKKNRLLCFALLWIFITLLPVSNILFLKGRPIAEQRLYIPSVGFCLLLGVTLSVLFFMNKGVLSGRTSKSLAAGLSLIIFSSYSLTTVDRNLDWSDPFTFWTRTAQSSPGSSRAKANLGIVYYSRGDTGAAVSLFEEAIKISPLYANAYNNLGAAYGSMGRTKKASEMITRALEIDPALPHAYNNLGNIFFQAGDIPKAVSYYQRAVELSPGQPDSYYNLFVAYRSSGELEKAAVMQEKIIEHDPYDAEAYYELGLLYGEMMEIDKAVSSHKKAISLDPGHARAYNALGALFGALGRKEDSIALFEKAVDLDPDNPEFLGNLGSAYSQSGDHKEALVLLHKALELDPDNAGIYAALGALYGSVGRNREEILMYGKALDLDPDNAALCNDLGLAYYSAGDHKSALNAYRKAIQIDPGQPDPYNNIGVAYASAGDMPEAARWFRRALEIDPERQDIRENLDAASARLSASRKLISGQEQALSAAPDDPEAYFALGNAQASAGNFKEAVEAYSKALAMAPARADIAYNLGNAYYDSGRAPEAVEAYKKAIALDPGLADAYYNLGRIYGQAGETDLAITYYMKALEKNPGFGEACYNLSLLYFRLKKYDLAIEYCDKAGALGIETTGLSEALDPYRKNER